MERLKGIVMIVFGAMLWGATGPMMEWILLNSEMSVSFMLTVRLLIGRDHFCLHAENERAKQLRFHCSKKFGPVNYLFSEYLVCWVSNIHLSLPLIRVMQ